MANKDTLIKMFEGIRDERTKHANTARRIGNAFLSMLDFASSAGDGKLSSVHDDIAQGFITFVKGLMVNQLAHLKGGASFGSDGSYSFDKDGNLVIESARSRDFDEMLQNGFALKRNPTSGKYILSISDLIVWGRMVINTLEVRKKYAIGGNVYLSGASSKIQHVETVYSEDGETVVGYKCYILKDDGTMATQNNWVAGDQALCQTFDIEEGVYKNVSNQYYWRLVTQVSEENVAITEKYIDKDGNEQIRELYEGQKFAWVVLSKDDCDTNSGVPASGDTIVLDGHRLTENEDTDYTERTNVLMLEATGSGSPRIIALTGVVDYKHTTDNEVFILSPRKVIFTTDHFEIRTASGAPITFVHFMGPWVKGTKYHYYDQVSHANALWTCIVEKGKSTTDEPMDGSTYWRKEMSGGKGEKGDDAVNYTLEASPGYIRLNSDGSIDYTNGYIDKGDEYGSDKYLVVRGYKVAKGVRDNRFSTEENPVTLRLTINDGSAYSEYTPSDGDSVSIDFEPKYEDSYYSMLEEISHSGLNSVRVDLCEGIEYDANKILATLDIPITQKGKDGENGDDGASYNINFVTHKDDIHNDTLLYVYVVLSVGKKSSNTLISNIPETSETVGLKVKVYCDGVYNENLTNHVKNSGYIQRSAWETVKNFEVRLYLNDKLVSSNSYSFGEQGADGEDAISILVEDAPLVFDTDDNGTVSSDVKKTAKIKVMKGNTNVTNDCSGISSMDSMCVNCKCSAAKKDKYIEISISGDDIIKNDVIVDGVNQGQISTTSGYAVAQFAYAGVTYFAQVPFSVNVAKFTGVVAFNNKNYKIQFDELSKNAATKDELNDATSTFEQTAREISLSVSEKTIGRRNLLVGSAFQRDDNNVEISDGARIEMNSGYHGTNCIHVIDDTDGTPHYPGAFWDGSQGGKSIEITKGKKYIISCWYMTNDVNGRLYLEALYTDEQTNAKRRGGPNYLSPSAFTVKKVNEWELFTAVIDTTDAQYNYLAFNFFESCNGNYGRINAWICRPMVEEGEVYNGWTLSEKDYDIIGANLIDNSRTLDAGGNIVEVKGKKTLVGDAYELKASGSDDYNTFYRIKGDAFKLNTDYTISFEVRGDAKYMGAYVSYPATNTKFTCYKEPQNGAMFEATGDGSTADYVSLIEVKELSKQQRVWVHFRFKDRLPEELYFQFPKNAEQTGVTSWNVTITRPKIEVGAVVTEYTERKSDLVDKASLKAAGIVVNSESVTLYGSQVHIKKNKDDTNDTVLIDNNTGKVSAGLINADEVVARGIKTQELEATSLKVTGNSKFGIWEIAKDDTFGEMIQARGDLSLPSGESVAGSGINYLPLYIRGGIADTASYFRVGVTCTEFSYPYNGFNDFCGVWVGKAADYVCGGVKNTNLNTPYAYGYSTSYHPAEYIYANKTSPNDPAFAINVQSKGTTGERTAIQTNAAIRGVFAPNSMSISSYNNDKTIPNGIGVVICTNNSEMTLTLPANPLEGQTLIIIQGSTSRVSIVPYGDEKIYCHGETRDKNTKFYSGTIGQFNIFVYVRGAWQLQWMNYKP